MLLVPDYPLHGGLVIIVVMFQTSDICPNNQKLLILRGQFGYIPVSGKFSWFLEVIEVYGKSRVGFGEDFYIPGKLVPEFRRSGVGVLKIGITLNQYVILYVFESFFFVSSRNSYGNRAVEG